MRGMEIKGLGILVAMKAPVVPWAMESIWVFF